MFKSNKNFAAALILAMVFSCSALFAQPTSINYIKYADESHFLAGSDGSGVIQSKDGGSSWFISPTPFVTPYNSVNSICRMTDTRIAAAGNGGVIILSPDNGDSFIPVVSGTSENLNDIKLSGQFLFAAGTNGTILRSEDLGKTWTALTSNTVNTINKIYAASDGRVIFIGDNGLFLQTEDNGENFSAVDCGGKSNLRALAMDENDYWTLMGDNSAIFNSTDAGLTWETHLPIIYSLNPKDIYIISPGRYLTVGDGGMILLSNDQGFSWNSVSTEYSMDLKTVSFYDNYNGVTTGTGGHLLFTTNGGYNWSETRAVKPHQHDPSRPMKDVPETITPNTFKLNQNYPNPFNPSTNISFQLPSDSKVTLKIFDMAGKEVAVLANDFRQAGSYSITFNAAGLASGVYFYRLESKNFTETKKMILTK